MDFKELWNAQELDFYSDASGKIGLRAVSNKSWMHAIWPPQFLAEKKPSIQYLELFALTAVVLCWIRRYKNRRIIIFCDNQAVVKMINNSTSSCTNCMVLLRMVVLECMIQSVKIFARYVKSADNKWADLLSRDLIQQFKNIVGDDIDANLTPVPEIMWPIHKIWVDVK